MGLLKPTLSLKTINDLNIDILQKLDIKLILLDVDNTIASYISKDPVAGSLNWIKEVKSAGYIVYIVSNNYEKRVSAIAEKFQLPYISFAAKPMTIGFTKARKKLKLKKHECLVVGDQIFTDILGANIASLKSVLLEPIELETTLSIKIRRHFEKKLRKNFNN
ncbi:MAG: YqeG family HAD IIIA-type phosphatase [Clostridia bacterium]